MNRTDLAELLEPGRFSPFVITTVDGAAFPVGPAERGHVLAAARMVVIMDSDGNLTHIPYSAIAHLHEPKMEGEK